MPVHKQPMQATFPVPEQAAQVGDDEENSGELEVAEEDTPTPLPEDVEDGEEDDELDELALALAASAGSRASSGSTPAPAHAPHAT